MVVFCWWGAITPAPMLQVSSETHTHCSLPSAGLPPSSQPSTACKSPHPWLSNLAEAERAGEEPAVSSVQFCQERRPNTRNMSWLERRNLRYRKQTTVWKPGKLWKLHVPVFFSNSLFQFPKKTPPYIYTHTHKPLPCISQRKEIQDCSHTHTPPPKRQTTSHGSWPTVTTSHLKKGSCNTFRVLKSAPHPLIPHAPTTPAYVCTSGQSQHRLRQTAIRQQV